MVYLDSPWAYCLCNCPTITEVIDLPHQSHPIILSLFKSSMNGNLLHQLEFHDV